LALATILLPLSEDQEYQRITLPKAHTFFSAAISHAYYCIFFTAKAYLQTQRVTVRPPREHEQVYDRFAWFVESGILDKQLLALYEDAKIKAEALLDIFADEKKKRTRFTYKKLPQANKAPAEESVVNATEFYKRVGNLC